MPGPGRPQPRFAHESELRLSELLDFYGVAWEYEPVSFVLEWDGQGHPRSAFRPDFYLPEHDLFLELTTLRQDLVTRKHRKLRRMAELYPDRRVKILYRRDDAHLALKVRLAAGSGQRGSGAAGTRPAGLSPAAPPPARGAAAQALAG